MSRLLTLVAIVISVLLPCSRLCAQQPIPPASFAKLQDVFTGLRDRLWDTSDHYWHSGEFNRCIASMRLITQMDPRDTEAYSDTAWLMWSDLREADAEAFLREGLANNTDTYEMYNELGSFCYFRTRYDEAIVYLTGATSFSDCPPFVWHQLAHAYEHAGRVGDSLETWFEIQAMEPDNGVVQVQIDRILSGGEMSREPEITLESIRHRMEERSKGLPD